MRNQTRGLSALVAVNAARAPSDSVSCVAPSGGDPTADLGSGLICLEELLDGSHRGNQRTLERQGVGTIIIAMHRDD